MGIRFTFWMPISPHVQISVASDYSINRVATQGNFNRHIISRIQGLVDSPCKTKEQHHIAASIGSSRATAERAWAPVLMG